MMQESAFFIKKCVKTDSLSGEQMENRTNDYTVTTKPADTSAAMPILPFAAIAVVAAGGAFIMMRKKTSKK